MKPVFEIDVLHCPHCGGRRRLIALITEPLVVRRILRHLDLPCEPPPIAPARPPPQMVLGFSLRGPDSRSPSRSGQRRGRGLRSLHQSPGRKAPAPRDDQPTAGWDFIHTAWVTT
jgi:hypothetical protein